MRVINETWSTDKVLKNANFLQQGTDKNLTTPLYSQTTKPEIFFDEKGYKNGKITKPSHAYKVCLSTHSVEILNSFNPELQLKGTAFVIRNKLKKLFTELRGFKFVTELVLEFKMMEQHNKKYSTFYSILKSGTINESNIDDLFKSIYCTIVSNT